MMDDSPEKRRADMESLAAVVGKDLLLPVPQKELLVDEDVVLDWLVKHIGRMLDTDPNRLLQALYRIDVDENKVRMAFASPRSTARLLGIYIIERMKKKLEYRKKYRASGKS